MFFSRSKKKRFNRIAALATLIVFWYLYGSGIKTKTCAVLPTSVDSLLCGSEQDGESWNLFYHLGGNGPWIPKVAGVVEHDFSLPPGCVIDQVHMLSRHAERYPTRTAGTRQLQLIERLKAPNQPLRGSLSFLRKWQYFTDPTRPDFENLTYTGRYSGTRQAFNTGTKLRKRYNHLIQREKSTSFWSCSSPRDVETAKYFADGFFGYNWHTNGMAKLHVIPETPERGGDTLTPGDTCLKYIEDKEEGHDQGYGKLAAWQIEFSKPIIERLQPEIAGFELTPIDVYSMMEMCGFEMLVRGSSPWCAVFTKDEWLDFEYGRDLLHFYRAGPGNKYAGAMGWLWLSATQELMSNDTAKGVFFSFVHDGDIVPLLATLELLNEATPNLVTAADFWNTKPTLPVDRVKVDRRWKTSDIVPMGGRVIFERIDCRQAPHVQPHNETFVRFLINDGHISSQDHFKGDLLPHDKRLERFETVVRAKERKFGDFKMVCGLDESAPSKIMFLHQDT